MLHHCYFAVQSALERTFLARRAPRIPSTISLVAMAEALGNSWSVPERELLVTLTQWYRMTDGNSVPAGGILLSKDDCLHTLTVTAELVRTLRMDKRRHDDTDTGR